MSRQAWLKLRQLAWRLGADVSLEALEQCCRERYGAWAEMLSAAFVRSLSGKSATVIGSS